MTSESFLADVGSYNAVTIDPYQGACGLSLFINNLDTKEEIRRYLQDCKQYCEVFRNIEDMNKALQIDIMIYTGLMKLFPNKEERDKWKEDIQLVSKTIITVLDALSDKMKKIDKRDIEKSIKILIELRNIAEEKLHMPEEEVFYSYA